MGRGALLGLLSGLSDILTAVFQPLLKGIINIFIVPIVRCAIQVVFTVIQYFTSAIFYEISKFLLGLIDFVEVLFRALAGLPSTASSGSEITFSLGGKSGDLLIQMLTSKEVLQVFYATAIVGVFLLIITTIFSMIKVEYTTEGAQNSKSSIIGKSLKSLCNMLIIPLLCVMGVFIGNQVLDLIDTATGGGNGSKISGVLWVTAASGAMLETPGSLNNEFQMDVDSDAGLIGAGVSFAVTRGFEEGLAALFGGNPPDPIASLGNPSGRETIEDGFMKASSGHNYYKVLDVIEYYNPFEVNYLVLIFGACIIIKCLYHTCFGLIDRLYQCTALFIVMPMVVGMSPVKDSLGSWRSKFISKALSAYGTVISLNLFFIIVTILLNIDIKFGSAYNDWIFPPTFMAGLIKAIMVIVGCLMIEKLAGDLGGYFGGGNAMADGKGLAKEATAGVTKAAMAAGMVATGGASLLAKGVKGTVGIAGKIGKGVDNLSGGRISEGLGKAKQGVKNKVDAGVSWAKKTKIGQSATKFVSGAKNTASKVTNFVNDKRAGVYGAAKADDELKAASANFSKTQFDKTKTKEEKTAAKERLEKAKTTVAKNNERRAALKQRDTNRKEALKQSVDNAKMKFAVNKEATRQYVENKFGAEAAFKMFAPKALQDERKAYQDAYKQANSASPEGEAMMANIEKAKKDKAEAAYDARNRGAIEARKLAATNLILTTTNAKLADASIEATANLNKLNEALEKVGRNYAKEIAKGKNADANTLDMYTKQAESIRSQMTSLNGKIEFGGAFKVQNTSDLKVDFKMDQNFMEELQKQVKKGVKMDDIMEEIKKEFKRIGLEGNDKLLNEIYKSLEELKGQVGGGK